MRPLWAAGGYLSLGLGLIGIVVPLMPTVVFLLLAAFCFARSSDRMFGWLTTHPTLGPPIRDWRERGAIGLREKVLASLSMAVVLALSAVAGLSLGALALQAAVLAAVAVFIWTRPGG
jgi:uncharacterized protein